MLSQSNNPVSAAEVGAVPGAQPVVVTTLGGADLALWVARAVKVKTPGDRPLYASGACLYVETQWGGGEPFSYRPDCRWSDGGPLIERHLIDLECFPDPVLWKATLWDGRRTNCCGEGGTPLTAAMRALVASVYGDTVPGAQP